MGEPIRVVIADDHPQFRRGLRALLMTSPDVQVVGEAADGREAGHQVVRLQPDVVLMALNMPGKGGIEATREMLDESPHVGVLVLTMVEDDDSVFAALQAGARGYLLKGALKAEVLRSVRAVASGEAIFGSGVAKRLVGFFAPRGTINRPATAFPELTPREQQILQMLAQHATNPEIAERLRLSPKTVRNQVSTILAKLRVATRSEAIVQAREAGLGRDRT